MRLLLDTHALIWAVMSPQRLGDTARDAILDSNNVVYASHVSLWELAIKRRIGKLTTIDRPAGEWFETYVRASKMQALSISAAHLGAVEFLPLVHGDPFDRLLVAQAQLDGMTVVTRDPAFAHYDVATLW